MLSVTQYELFPGVRLTAVHTKKFKSTVLGAQLLAPLDRRSASRNALVPPVLRRGTLRHPDLEALTRALDELYGGALDSAVRKKGEVQCLGFHGSFLDEAYAPKGSGILEQATELLSELLLRPVTEKGGFLPEYVEGERKNLIEQIRARKNDKRRYADFRLIQEMCAQEPYGVARLGDEGEARAVTAQELWSGYEQLLRTSPLELYCCGSAEPERMAELFSRAFAALPRGERLTECEGSVRLHVGDQAPRVVEEELDVTQGKLSLGFRTGGACIWEESYPALLLFNAVYGGSTTSKLFLNVRERMSLCYYASSAIEKFKGILRVSSGVAFEHYGQARDEILSQLEQCRAGNISREELEGARRQVVGELMTTSDSQSALENYWLGQAVAGLSETPEELARRVEQVTLEQVVETAASLELDTIYFLKGKER